jgi:DNA-binding NarL/FixJ family response regulator
MKGHKMKPDADRQKGRVFIVDDYPLVREWLGTLVNQQSDLQVCGETANAADALKLISTVKPHVAILDISMPGGLGIELIKNIKAVCPEMEVLVFSLRDKKLHRERAIRAGASDYVTKREATRDVLRAIRCLLEEKFHLSEKTATSWHESFDCAT